MNEQLLSTDEMRTALLNSVGSQYPFRIKKKNLQILEGYIRGFADSQNNIVLVSEKSDSISMRIVEIKNIDEIVYPTVRDQAVHQWILRAR